MIFIALTLGWLAFLLLILVFILAQKAEKYRNAFRDTATKLYNVTIERDALVIENVGYKAALIREREIVSRLRNEIDGEIKFGSRIVSEVVTTLKPAEELADPGPLGWGA